MVDYIIKKSDIYIAKIVMFDDCDEEDMLTIKDLSNDEIYRKVLLKDGYIIDFETKDIILTLETSDYKISGEIYGNTMYCLNLITDISQVSDNDLLYANELYKGFLEQQEFVKQGKIILFPRRRIH